MLSRTYAMEPEDSPSPDSEDTVYEPLDTEQLKDIVPNWLGMGVVGALLMIVGFIFLSVSSTVGGGVLIIGLLMLAGARLAWKWESDDTAFSDPDYQWQEEFGPQTIDDDFQDMTTARQKEIEEIVKAVKSTIRVRCRYCGTLNEEKANNCESCGANL